MPLKINLCAPCDGCNECCEDAWPQCISCWSVAAFISYLATNVAINSEMQGFKGSDIEKECIERALPYSWASLVNLLFIIALCVFSLISVDTRGKYNDCTSRDRGCSCCAAFIWFVLLVGSVVLCVIGTIGAQQTFNCLPEKLIALISISLILQYGTALASLVAFLFRSQILTYE